MKPSSREISLAALFVGLALLFTWPLGEFWHPRLPDADDAMFSVWRLAWIAHQLPIAPVRLFDANIFWPEANTLAFSDAMLLLGVVGLPFIRLGVHPVVVHNLLAIAAFAFAGYSCSRLMGYFTVSVPARIVAGMIFAFAPYRFAHIVHLELLWTAFLPLALLALFRVVERPSVRGGVALGAAAGFQGLCSLYYLVFLIIWLAPALLLACWRVRYAPSRHHVIALVSAALVSGVLLSPYFAPYSKASEQLPPRSAEDLRRYSATPSDYLHMHSHNWLYQPDWTEAEDEHSLFVGGIAFVLAISTVVFARTRTSGMLAGLAIIAVDLSFGVNGLSYALLQKGLPPLEHFRAPARFGVLALLPVAILAGLTMERITAAGGARARAITAAIIVGLGAEYWFVPINVRAMPLEPPRVYQWLASQPGTVTLELPLPTLDRLWLFESTYQYMSIYHWQPLINGYSGHAPHSYEQLLEVMRHFPSDESIALLRQRGVQVVLLNERFFEHGGFDALLLACQDRRWFRDAMVFPDFELKRVAACLLQSPGEPQ